MRNRNLIHSTAKLLTFVAGLLLLYSALFLYENEQGRLQNKLESWWVRLDDQRNRAVSRHTAFMRETARFVGEQFDAVFGHHLLSIRVIVLSEAYALSSVGLTYIVFDMFLYHRKAYGFPTTFLFASTFAAMAAALSLTRYWNVLPSATSLAFGAVLLLLWILMLGPYPHTLYSLDTMLREFSLCDAIPCSLICDLGFLITTRWSLRWCSSVERFSSIVMMICINVILAITLVLGPCLIAVYIHFHFRSATWLLLSSTLAVLGVMNFLDAILASTFVVLAVLMLLHRLVWPVIERPLYSLAGLGIARRRKLFGVLGIGLLLEPTLNMTNLLKKTIELLTG